MLGPALRNSARPYLFAVIAAVVFSKFLQYLWQYVFPEIPLIYGQAPGIYVKAILIVLAALLWLTYRGHRVRDPWLTAFLAILVFGWLTLMPIALMHNDGTTYDMFLYVPVLIAFWLKPPSALDLTAAFIFLGWLVVSVLVATRAAEILELIPMVDVGPEILTFEIENYWLPLAGMIGPEGRWPGPMGHNAMTGNAAAMLVILAVAVRSKSRWIFGIVGTLALLMTASRGSQLGALVGIAVVLVLGTNPLTRRVSRKVLLSALAGVIISLFAAAIIHNPSLTGRTGYWSLALDAWQSSPLIGVGLSGFGGNSELAIAGTNAHNLIFDAIVKYGLAGAAFITAILACSAWITYRSTRIQIILPLGIFAAYLTIGLAESDQGWLGISLQWLWLTLAVLLASRSWEESVQSANRGGEPREGSVCTDTEEELTPGQ